MHHRNINLHIRKETNSLFFSDCTTTTASAAAATNTNTHSAWLPSQKNLPIQLQTQSINTSHHPHNHLHHHHLQIKISPFSSSPHPSTKPSSAHQSSLQNEPFCQNQSTNNTILFATPHRRSTMKQSSNLSLCSSLPLILATRRITLKFIHHSCQPTWIKLHLKLFMFFFVPSLYLFTSIWPFILYVFCIVIISTFLVFSCNTALPSLPLIRLLLTKTLPSKAHNHHHHPVIWSIGSKAKPEKRPSSGCWVQVYSNGDVYEGEFHKGKCSGSGVYHYRMSGRFEGDWVDGKYDGYGVETWEKGSRYRGQYRLGLRHGVGLYRSYTGDVYGGEWFNGQCHGCGVHTCADGSSYVGEFKYGVKHGLGHYHFRNGDTYAGEYFADKMHGFGVYSFGNGHRYEGAWHEGRRQGLGMYTYRNGETQSGHWQNGVLNVSITQSAAPGSPITVDRQKVLNAVQESKRASDKAFNVAKVDERVNRAILAANRAATAARVAAVKAVQNRMFQNNNDLQIPVV